KLFQVPPGRLACHSRVVLASSFALRTTMVPVASVAASPACASVSCTRMSLSLSIVKIIVLLLLVIRYCFTTASPPVPGGRGAGHSVALRHDLLHLAVTAVGPLRPYDVALRAGWLAAAFQILRPGAHVARGDLAR